MTFVEDVIEDAKEEIFRRPHRTLHFVGGDSGKFLAKIDTAKSGQLSLGERVDGLLLNLEDAVAENKKTEARSGAATALKERNFGSATVWARINGIQTDHYKPDLNALVGASASGTHLEIVMVPKIESAGDLRKVESDLLELEEKFGIKKPILLAGIIETAKGVHNIKEIAAATNRMHSLHFGPADLAASLRLKTLDIGGAHANCRTMVGGDINTLTIIDPWNPYIMALVTACRTNNILPFYGPYGRMKDEMASLVQFQAMSVRGCVGAWTLHPAQIAAAEQAFSPSYDELVESSDIVMRMKDAESVGSGAVFDSDGVMIDEARVKQALNFIRLAEQIASKDASYRELTESVGAIYKAAVEVVQNRSLIAA